MTSALFRLFGCSLVALSMAACTTDNDDNDDNTPADAGDTPDTGAEDMGVADMGTITSKCEPLGPELQAGTAPPRRGDMAFAYDTNCDRVIMFFGDKAEPMMCGPAGSIFFTDGWTFDPARNMWAEIPTPSGEVPIERARSAAVWDPSSNRMIMFGGRWRPEGSTAAYTFLNDLWAYDPSNNTWEELANSSTPNAPSGRMNMAMVADPERNRILIHDGGTTDFTAFVIDTGVWAYNLGDRSWEKLNIGGTLPTPRIFHMAAIDRMRSRLYVFGGGGEDAFTSTSFFSDTWYLDLNNLTWTEVTTDPRNTPAGRIKGTMEYDPNRDRLVLFAGHDDTSLGNENDVWSLTLDTFLWEQKRDGDSFNQDRSTGFCDFLSDFANVDLQSPERRESHLFVIDEDVAYMYGGRTDCGLSNDTWRLNLGDDTWQQINESFNGMTCYRSGRTDCDNPDARKCG